MVTYYSHLVHSLGGKVLAYYLNGMAVSNKGKISSLMETIEEGREAAFYMTDKPSAKRQPAGRWIPCHWTAAALTYFVENEDTDAFFDDGAASPFYQRLVNFLKDALQ